MNNYLNALVRENPKKAKAIERVINDKQNLEILGIVCQEYHGTKKKSIKIGNFDFYYDSNDFEPGSSNLRNISKKIDMGLKETRNKLEILKKVSLVYSVFGKNGTYYVPSAITTELFN